VIIERDTPGETNFVKRMDGRRKGGRNGVREETTVNVVRIDGDTDVAVNKDGKKPPTSSVPAAITAGQWRDPPDPARLGRSSHWGTASRMHVGPPRPPIPTSAAVILKVNAPMSSAPATRFDSVWQSR